MGSLKLPVFGTIAALSAIIFASIATAAPSADPVNWIKISSPLSTNYQAVASAGSTIWAVGEGGAVVKSTDGGSSFSAVNVGSSQAFYGVRFSGSQHGIIAGGGGTVLRTNDGGATWSPGSSGTGVDLAGISLPTPRVGYAGGNGGVIIKTTDCGRTWTQLNSGFNSDITNTFFVSENEGWAVGNRGIILHTTNGGATWDRQKEPGTDFDSLSGLFFLNSQIGWASGDPSPEGSGFRSNLWHTTNGGGVWTRVNVPVAGPQLSGIHFSNAQQGYVSAEEGLILATNNGGASWLLEDTPIPPGPMSWLLGVTSMADGSAVMVGQGSNILRRPAGAVVASFAAITNRMFLPVIQGNNPAPAPIDVCA